jgi:gliding motility-associated-like protein
MVLLLMETVKNDTWVIDYIDQYPNHVVEIYNRWGELLYRSTAYKNDWDGTYNGENLPVGTYYYVIELNDGKTKPFTGPLTVLR